MGVLIALAIGMLAYGMYLRFADPQSRLFKDRAPVPAAPLPGGFGEVRLGLGETCTIVEFRPEGDRLYVRSGPAGPCERIFLVDLRDGRVLGSIVPRP